MSVLLSNKLSSEGREGGTGLIKSTICYELVFGTKILFLNWGTGLHHAWTTRFPSVSPEAQRKSHWLLFLASLL